MKKAMQVSKSKKKNKKKKKRLMKVSFSFVFASNYDDFRKVFERGKRYTFNLLQTSQEAQKGTWPM